MKIRLPLLPTIIVLLAVAVMIGLGLWQLRRADEKQALKAQYRHALTMPVAAWNNMPDKSWLYRRASAHCMGVVSQYARGGANRQGVTGYRHIVRCIAGNAAEGPGLSVDIGWSQQPGKVDSAIGQVTGVIGPDPDYVNVLVAETPAKGLQPSALPDPETIPDNHVGYAIQWFSFALIAVIIYVLALRRRQVAPAAEQG